MPRVLDADPIPVGPRLVRVIELAWRTRKPLLLEGSSGVGKSEIVAGTAAQLQIDCNVLDLSLLEPPDLTGLPCAENGLARYAAPASLPRDGNGILVLEELNRAERYIRQPVLQLLSARCLNEYELPVGWSVVAAINPVGGAYHVDALDPALLGRFMRLKVCVDRESWLGWARRSGVHPGVIGVVDRNPDGLAEISPRTWKHVSDLLQYQNRNDQVSDALLRDALAGYLNSHWIETLLAMPAFRLERCCIDTRELLQGFARDPHAKSEIAKLRMGGRTDTLTQIAQEIHQIVSGNELSALARGGEFDLTSFEQLIAELPGDHAARLQSALGNNPDACPLLDVTPADVFQDYDGNGAAARVEQWLSRRTTRHRAWTLASALAHELKQHPNPKAVQNSRVARAGIGLLLSQLGPIESGRLSRAMRQLSISPIMPNDYR